MYLALDGDMRSSANKVSIMGHLATAGHGELAYVQYSSKVIGSGFPGERSDVCFKPVPWRPRMCIQTEAKEV